jgi:hypothetical protein
MLAAGRERDAVGRLLDYRMGVTVMEPKDLPTLLVALYAAVVATLNFAWPRIREYRESRTAVYRALQGEKEAIAEVAYRVTENEWDKANLEETTRLITALSMAFVMESSDRAKAYVYAAFKHLVSRGRSSELLAQLRSIQAILDDYANTVGDEEFRAKRVKPLESVIKHLGPLDTESSRAVSD